MITVQGPLWALLVAAALWLLMEATVHVREFVKDLRFNRARREHGAMPETWTPQRRKS